MAQTSPASSPADVVALMDEVCADIVRAVQQRLGPSEAATIHAGSLAETEASGSRTPVCGRSSRT